MSTAPLSPRELQAVWSNAVRCTQALSKALGSTQAATAPGVEAPVLGYCALR